MERMNISARIMVVVFIITTIISFINCTTKREIITEVHTDTIFNETHDTLVITQNKVDTIRDYQIIQKTDTIRDIQTRVITLKESGDTIREVVQNNVYHYVYQKDSTDKYKSKIDSLQKSISQLLQEKKKIQNSKDKEVVKEKKDYLGYITFFVFIIGLACIAFFAYKLFKFLK